MMAVAILSVLATVAVPSFVRYMRRARTMEAIEQLSRLSKGSAFYYARPFTNPNTGQKIPCQFPLDVAPTPIEGTCCGSLGASSDSDGDDRCDPDPTVWDDSPVWSSLSFQMNDQHYFVYAYDNNEATLADAQFTASAYGDLDCDNVQSTFQRIGYGDPGANGAECSMYAATSYYVNNEVE